MWLTSQILAPPQTPDISYKINQLCVFFNENDSNLADCLGTASIEELEQAVAVDLH